MELCFCGIHLVLHISCPIFAFRNLVVFPKFYGVRKSCMVGNLSVFWKYACCFKIYFVNFEILFGLDVCVVLKNSGIFLNRKKILVAQENFWWLCRFSLHFGNLLSYQLFYQEFQFSCILEILSFLRFFIFKFIVQSKFFDVPL